MARVSSYVHLSFLILIVASFSYGKAEDELNKATHVEHSFDIPSIYPSMKKPFDSITAIHDLENELSLNPRRARLSAHTESGPSLDRPRFRLPPFGRPKPKLPPFGQPTPKLPPFGQPGPGFKPPGRRFPPFSFPVPPPPHHKH